MVKKKPSGQYLLLPLYIQMALFECSRTSIIHHFKMSTQANQILRRVCSSADNWKILNTSDAYEGQLITQAIFCQAYFHTNRRGRKGGGDKVHRFSRFSVHCYYLDYASHFRLYGYRIIEAPFILYMYKI